jgi:biopolymer transport protein ExbB
MRNLWNVKTWTAALMLAGTSAWAQGTAAAQPTVQGMVESMSLQEIIRMGGPLMYVLAAMSVVAVALIVYFLIVLRQEQVLPRKVVAEIKSLLREGRRDEVREVCLEKPSPVSYIVLSAMNYLQGSDQAEAGMLKEILEGEGSRQAAMIQNQTQYLLDLGVIAPMVGLLGTVTGMLQAFNAVALDLAKAKPMLLAAGVSQALITTVAGLVIAIPAMLAYSYFRGKTSKLISRLESVSAELLTLLMPRRPQ